MGTPFELESFLNHHSSPREATKWQARGSLLGPLLEGQQNPIHASPYPGCLKKYCGNVGQ